MVFGTMKNRTSDKTRLKRPIHLEVPTCQAHLSGHGQYYKWPVIVIYDSRAVLNAYF